MKIKKINEMAYNKKNAIDMINGQQKRLLEHFIKCVVYKNEFNNLDHWTDEIADYLDYMNDIDVKTKNGRISQNEYQKLLYSSCGENEHDMQTYLKGFKLNNARKYKTFDITLDLAKEAYEKYHKFVDHVSKMMSIKNDLKQNDFKDIIKKFV